MPITSTEHTPGAGPRTPSARRHGLVAFLAANMLIDALEVSIMIVAMPTIAEDLGLSRTTAIWTITGFATGFAGALLLGGRLAARLGMRRVYLAALLVFVLASLLGAAADDPALLAAARALKGACAALTAPLGLAIISTALPRGRARDIGLSVYTLAGGAGFSVGLILAGGLTPVGWRWTFLVPAIIGAVVLIAGARLIPREGRAALGGTAAKPLGAVNATLFTLGVAACVLAITTAAERGWRDRIPLTCLVITALSALVLVVVERRSSTTLYRSPVLTNRTLLVSMAGAAAMNGTNLALLLIVTIRMQYDLGWGPLRTGLALLPASIPLVVAAPSAGPLLRRFPMSVLVAMGTASSVAAALTFMYPAVPDRYLTDVLPGMLLLGAAFAAGFAALNAQAVSTVDPARRAAATGLYQTAVQLAAAIVPAAVTAALVVGYRHAVVLAVVVALAGVPAAIAGVLANTRNHAEHSRVEK
ncbi:MFS transporter [Nocardia sp. 004]|uniref:MFS transporter n=1 Tax=Nocardia sp. 004 TaxID=3385978 RepID=UPI0039A065D2